MDTAWVFFSEDLRTRYSVYAKPTDDDDSGRAVVAEGSYLSMPPGKRVKIHEKGFDWYVTPFEAVAHGVGFVLAKVQPHGNIYNKIGSGGISTACEYVWIETDCQSVQRRLVGATLKCCDDLIATLRPEDKTVANKFLDLVRRYASNEPGTFYQGGIQNEIIRKNWELGNELFRQAVKSVRESGDVGVGWASHPISALRQMTDMAGGGGSPLHAYSTVRAIAHHLGKSWLATAEARFDEEFNRIEANHKELVR